MIESISAHAVAEACQGRYIPGVSHKVAKIKGLAIDSRQVRAGDLFAALPGERVDGHTYAVQAANDGASAVLVEREVDVPCAQIVVGNVERAIGEFGRLARQAYGGVLVGVTGSAGKTTAKNLLAAILKEAGNTVATSGNLNNELGVPLTLATLKPTTEFAVVEMGAGKPGDIAYLQTIVRPTVAVLLSVAPAHIEYFASLDAIAETKGAILDGLSETGLAVINGDLPWSKAWADRAAPANVVTFGFEKGVDVRAKDIRLNGFGGSRAKVVTPQGVLTLELALPGRQGVANALAAIAVGLSLGLSHAAITRALSRVKPAAGRGAPQFLPGNVVLVDDTYNANPLSVSAALDVLAGCSGRKRFVMGSMLELGSQAAQHHCEVGAKARALGIDELWAIGDLAALAAECFGDTSHCYPSVEALLDAHPACINADTVLVKASRGAALDRLVHAWQHTERSGKC